MGSTAAKDGFAPVRTFLDPVIRLGLGCRLIVLGAFDPLPAEFLNPYLGLTVGPFFAGFPNSDLDWIADPAFVLDFGVGVSVTRN